MRAQLNNLRLARSFSLLAGLLLLAAGQVGDYRGAAPLLPALPNLDVLIAATSSESDPLCHALARRAIAPCTPGAHQKRPLKYDVALYKQRNLIERIFGRLKGWRRTTSRSDRCLQRRLPSRYRALLIMSPEPSRALPTTG